MILSSAGQTAEPSRRRAALAFLGDTSLSLTAKNSRLVDCVICFIALFTLATDVRCITNLAHISLDLKPLVYLYVNPDRAEATLTSLRVYPVKSCAGHEVQEAKLGKRGLEMDRLWMIVDRTGRFMSQRRCSKMALVTPSLPESLNEVG